jgi:hypothetical protein
LLAPLLLTASRQLSTKVLTVVFLFFTSDRHKINSRPKSVADCRKRRKRYPDIVITSSPYPPEKAPTAEL